jgi:hypothetical protein
MAPMLVQTPKRQRTQKGKCNCEVSFQDKTIIEPEECAKW